MKKRLIVAITGYAMKDDLHKSRQAGFEMHLVKPVSPGALLQLLEEAPAQASASDEGRVVDIATHRKPV